VEVLILQVFVSLVLVVGSLILFGHSMRQRDHEHADRLALFPIADDDAVPRAPVKPPSPREETHGRASAR
jgi:hypothetical protein